MDIFTEAVTPRWLEFDADPKPVHDWRTYVTEGIRYAWFNLSIETRIAVIQCCEQAADREKWN